MLKKKKKKKERERETKSVPIYETPHEKTNNVVSELV